VEKRVPRRLALPAALLVLAILNACGGGDGGGQEANWAPKGYLTNEQTTGPGGFPKNATLALELPPLQFQRGYSRLSAILDNDQNAIAFFFGHIPETNVGPASQGGYWSRRAGSKGSWSSLETIDVRANIFLQRLEKLPYLIANATGVGLLWPEMTRFSTRTGFDHTISPSEIPFDAIPSDPVVLTDGTAVATVQVRKPGDRPEVQLFRQSMQGTWQRMSSATVRSSPDTDPYSELRPAVVEDSTAVRLFWGHVSKKCQSALHIEKIDLASEEKLDHTTLFIEPGVCDGQWSMTNALQVVGNRAGYNVLLGKFTANTNSPPTVYKIDQRDSLIQTSDERLGITTYWGRQETSVAADTSAISIWPNDSVLMYSTSSATSNWSVPQPVWKEPFWNQNTWSFAANSSGEAVVGYLAVDHGMVSAFAQRYRKTTGWGAPQRVGHACELQAIGVALNEKGDAIALVSGVPCRYAYSPDPDKPGGSMEFDYSTRPQKVYAVPIS